MAETMRAVVAAGAGGPEVLQVERHDVPRPGAGQLLVRVVAAGVNRPDVMQREGRYPPPAGAGDVLGLEISGTVAAVGGGVEHWREGDAVCALTIAGGYAEFCLVDAPLALPVPSGLALEDAAALPETSFTVWHNVFERGALDAGETLLVHGGASGIGTTAIQIATALGARVFVTAGGADKCRACETLGAARAIDYRAEDFVAVVKAETEGRGVDVILDMIGGDYLARNMACAAEDGRIVQIAAQNGASNGVELMRLAIKRLTLTGSTLRARPLAIKARLAAEVERHVWPLVGNGRFRPVISRRFSLAEVGAAHAFLESGENIGKILLTMD